MVAGGDSPCGGDDEIGIGKGQLRPVWCMCVGGCPKRQAKAPGALPVGFGGAVKLQEKSKCSPTLVPQLLHKCIFSSTHLPLTGQVQQNSQDGT